MNECPECGHEDVFFVEADEWDVPYDYWYCNECGLRFPVASPASRLVRK